MTTLKAVRAAGSYDSVSKRAGVFTVRRGFFYTNGQTSQAFAARVAEQNPGARILDYGEVWKPFRGGAAVADQSHWWAKFTFPEEGS